MRARTDKRGRARIAIVSAGGDAGYFSVAGIDGVAFAPETDVEIADERLENALQEVAQLAPLASLGPWRIAHVDR